LKKRKAVVVAGTGRQEKRKCEKDSSPPHPKVSHECMNLEEEPFHLGQCPIIISEGERT
jgi:hypothetical protein